MEGETVATARKSRMLETRIDLDEDTREQLAKLLNQRLADTSDLYSQVKQAHWSVRGTDFWQLHELYDAVADAIEPWIDEVAERITTLGGIALGTVRCAALSSSLDEFPPETSEGMETVSLVADRLAAYAAATREAIDNADELDPTTADLLTDISRVVDKQLWFVEAQLS
jgi:starvation-inducible DNA-binding protein